MNDCKTIETEELGMVTHYVEEQENEWFTFTYCVAYRDPWLPEWILARWYWNDQWIWIPEWIRP